MKNKRLRNIVLGVVGVVLTMSLISALTWAAVIGSIASAAYATLDAASQSAATSSGVAAKDLPRYREIAEKSGLPWPVVASLAKTLNKDPDVATLSDLLDKEDPGHAYRDLGTGSVVTDEGATRIIGKNDTLKKNAEKVEQVHVKAFTAYPGMDEQQAKATYDRALGWTLGQEQRCAPVGGTGDGSLTVKGVPMDGEQVEITKIILGIIKSALPNASTADQTQAAHISISTAIVETRITNHSEKVDHTSLGVFQQQDWWGTDEQRLRPDWATARFLKALFGVPNWQVSDPGVVAQTVQVSAFPDRYTQYMGEARAIVAAYWNKSPAVAIPADIEIGVPVAPGGAPGTTPGQSCITATGPWVLPFNIADGGKISDWFSMPYDQRPDGRKHTGIDIAMDEGKPVLSASTGTVLETSGGRPDGGLGYYAIIRHGTVVARYLHFVDPPMVKVGDQVKPGQQIGKVGTTGDSTGNHLHFDLAVNGQKIDPVPYMLQRGVDWRIVPLSGGIGPY
ncbi:M23 family metallopeptidase [Agromyces sp. NPDC057679]|uniref:M23 family metallopeptidase n=1 Tax=Agromyces sp. NPDC057679 TaxID=3346207 RepID=UPI00366BBA96